MHVYGVDNVHVPYHVHIDGSDGLGACYCNVFDPVRSLPLDRCPCGQYGPENLSFIVPVEQG